MNAPTLQQLEQIARRVIGRPGIALAPAGRAADVPGWDSLNHTLIVLEINHQFGIDLSPFEAAKAATFADLLALVAQAASSR